MVCETNQCPFTKMTATGLPKKILICSRLTKLENSMESLCVACNDIDVRSERRLHEVADILPNKIVEVIVDRIQIDGVNPITRADMEVQFNRYHNDLRNDIHSFIIENFGPGGASSSNPPRTASNESDCSKETQATHGYYSYHWGGKFHPVPEGFLMPLVTVKQLWDMWLFGNATDRVSCLRYVKPSLDLDKKSCKVNFSKAKKIMKLLIELSEKSVLELVQLSAGESDEVFATAFKKLSNYDDNENTKRRYSELQYNNLHSMLKDLNYN